MYGVAILPDGSIIFNMQESSGGLVRVGYCGDRIWSLDGVFHHAVSLTDQGTFWTFEGFQSDFDHLLTLVDVEELPTHGGSLRIFAQHTQTPSAKPSQRVVELKAREQAAGMLSMPYYQDFSAKAARISSPWDAR